LKKALHVVSVAFLLGSAAVFAVLYATYPADPAYGRSPTPAQIWALQAFIAALITTPLVLITTGEPSYRTPGGGDYQPRADVEGA
jgi:hypothetical protein